MVQVKKRNDGKLKRRFMCTICFYQDSRHERPLFWIRKALGIGYISKRNDGITELRVNGYEQAARILKRLLPFLKFKKRQADAMYKAATLLAREARKTLTPPQLRKLVRWILIIQSENYATRKKKNESDFLRMFGLTP